MANILFFFTSSYPYGSGETFIENEIGYLARAFDRVVIISNDMHSAQTREVPPNITLERMPYELNSSQKVISPFFALSSLFFKEIKIIRDTYKLKLNKLIINTMLVSLTKRFLFRRKIETLVRKHSSTDDSVYLYSYWANDIAVAITSVSLPNVKKKICRAHGWDVYFEANKSNYLPFRKLLFMNLNTLCFISRKGFDYYQKMFPELQHNICVSYLGVPIQKYNTEKCNQIFSIVSCSSIIPLKRVNLIAQALCSLSEFEIDWIHFGNGPLFDDLSEYCKVNFHKPTLHYKLKGYVENKDVVHFYETHFVDCFINVSSTEGIPVSIMEAMSFGIPVIATNVGGTTEIVKDGFNGFLLSPNPTPLEIANAIKKLKKNSIDEKLKMRQNAYATWEHNYNADKTYKSFVAEIFPF